ncbi:MAG: exodeoxyribonuclease III [Acidobacteria bacterium ACB1]|nr:Exodeoxyribonuclease III [Pyrinomonadaceae bacterium]MCE7961349.1 exodeoxyribonuclease III [Acidobacteria bacterium ACB1]RIJ91659.1 MAG: exodeoxyribonuclease III [Acidobacteriota bacterium]
MKIATWNVNSINVRMPQLLAWLDAAKPDIVCLQETKVVDANFPELELKAAGYDSAFTGQKSYNGVAILSRLPIEDVQLNLPDDDAESQKRLIAATIDGIRIVNTYIPNGSELGSDKYAFKLDWLMRLRRFFDATCSKENDVLLCGDFNVAIEPADVWNPAAWEGKIHFSKPERAAITFVKQWGFRDLFRELNGDVREFSWWDYRAGAFQHDHGLRIDHIWTSQKLTSRAAACRIDRSTRTLDKPSDHAPVIAEFN